VVHLCPYVCVCVCVGQCVRKELQFKPSLALRASLSDKHGQAFPPGAPVPSLEPFVVVVEVRVSGWPKGICCCPCV
jgi:hypothetical protein